MSNSELWPGATRIKWYRNYWQSHRSKHTRAEDRAFSWLYRRQRKITEECPECGSHDIVVKICKEAVEFKQFDGTGDLIFVKSPCHCCKDCGYAWTRGNEAGLTIETAVAAARIAYAPDN